MMTKTCSKFVFAISFFFIVMLAAFSNGWKNNGTRLELVREEGLFTLDEILGMDQLRVQSLQAADTNNINNNTNGQEDKHAVQITTKSGEYLGSGGYVVTIGLGSHSQNLTLLIDTGSDLTWTQCLPCNKNDCFPQEEPIFNPSESTTYSIVDCKSQFCADLGSQKTGGPSCTHLNPYCTYFTPYGDGTSTSTSGFYSRDVLSLSRFERLQNFRFGCSKSHTGYFRRYAGILGLGRGPTSFVSQRKVTFNQVFYYCLPKVNSRGFLSFGPGLGYDEEKRMVFTPFVPGRFPSFYYIGITGISVGGVRLRIPLSVFTTAAGAILDSGTVVTHLPPVAYKALAKQFKRQMGWWKSAPPYSPLMNICFHVKKNDLIPTMSFTFTNNATIDIAPSGIFYSVGQDWACLAFTGNKYPGALTVLGSTMQTQIEVMYDVPRKQFGFRSNPSCF